MIKSRDSRLNNQKKWRVRPIAAACSSLFFVAGASYAQEVPTDAQTGDKSANGVETVVVTGIKHSIESSIATKRNSDSIVEAVSSEDIGKLPDVSIAEALSRLPGLAAQNVAGRAQVIAIRGMSPDFAGTLLNGREQTTTGVNRGVEFDQYPAELMSSATVYKTPDATLLGQGLSGTIDLHSIRPLDFTERKITANVRGELNSQGDMNNGNGGTSDKGGRFSASYVNQFADHTIGLALGYAHLDAPSQEKQFQLWGYNQQSICAANCVAWGNGVSPGLDPNATYANGFQAETISRDEKRDGLMGVLEYKPNKDFHSTVDLFYSQFKQNEVMTGLMGNLGDWAHGAPNSYANTVYSNQGGYQVLQSATLTGGNLVVRNDFNTRDDKVYSLGWNTEGKIKDWKAIVDLSYSRANRAETLFESYAGSTLPTNMVFDIGSLSSPGSFSSAVNYNDPSTMFLGAGSAAYAQGNFGKKQVTNTNDIIKALNLHGKHDLSNILSQIDVGVDYSVRDKVQDFHVYNAVFNNPTGTTQGNPSMAIPAGLSSANVAGNSVLSYNPYSLSNLYTFHDVTGTSIGFGGTGSKGPTSGGAVSGDFTHDFGVHEKITTMYVKTDVDTQIGKLPLHGNVGAQLIHTDQSSNAFSFGANNTITPFSAGTTYNDFLPSLNLVGDLAGDRKLRVGLAKTLARPRMDDMNASTNATVSLSGGLNKWNGSGGNPKLKPWRAESFDLSLEQYFGKRSYVAGALFYKKLQSYIYSQTVQNYDFTGYINSTAFTPVSNFGQMTTQVNGSGGNMQGYELSGTLDAALLTQSLDGFGAQASFSQTGSSIKVNGPGGGTPIDATLPGLSKYVAGLTVFYEKYGYSVRINDRYRSSFRGEYSYLFGQTSVINHLSQETVDLQLGYEFQEGKGKGFGITLQVVNLTNTADRMATSFLNASNPIPGASAPLEYDTFGRSVLLGLSYKM